MKKKFLLLIAACTAIIPTALAYSFSVVVPSGQRLYFNTFSNNTVAVTSENTDYPYYSTTTEPTGHLVIPATVAYNGTIYNVTWITHSAFYKCRYLNSVTIPNSVTSIGNDVFRGCTRLASVTIGSGVSSIGERAFYDCSGLTSVTIGGSVTTIGNYAFYGCSSLTSITISDGVTSIGYGAFSGCSALTSVTIGGSVTSIGNGAFRGCSSLTSVTIPGVSSIGIEAFYHCTSLSNVTIGNSVTSIGDRAFDSCINITNITIPSSVTEIGSYAFINCTNLETLNYNAIFCGGGGFIINGSETLYVGTWLYHCTRLSTVIIGENVRFIPWGIFAHRTGITSITIPDSVIGIGSYAFYGCRGLTSVTIGSSVDTMGIGHAAFQNCSSLTSITVYAELPPTLGDNVFNEVPSNINVYVPCGKQPLYLASWTHFSNFIEMCNSSIDDVNALSANVYSVQGRIVVESGNGGPLGEVRVCDMMGRSLATCGVSAEGTNRYSFYVPATGTYFVKIGNLPARKVVVIR